MTEPKRKVILFGDSLTAWSFDTEHGKGFGDVLTKHFEGRADVDNEGSPGETTRTLQSDFSRIIRDIRANCKTPPLLFTIFLGANDAVFIPSVFVPLDQYAANIRSFVDTILSEPKMSTTKILLITPPPINAWEAVPTENLAGDIEEMDPEKWEEECRDSAGFKQWASKLKYAQKIMDIAKEYEQKGERRVAALDFWRAVTDYGLVKEGGEKMPEGEVDVETNGKWPGSGLPGAKEFGTDVFTDRLHLGETGYWVLSDTLMKALGETWPELM